MLRSGLAVQSQAMNESYEAQAKALLAELADMDPSERPQMLSEAMVLATLEVAEQLYQLRRVIGEFDRSNA